MSRHQPIVHGVRDTFPTNVPDLIKWLDTLCPEPTPRPGQTIEEVMFAAGRRDFAHQLRRQFERSLEPPTAL